MIERKQRILYSESGKAVDRWADWFPPEGYDRVVFEFIGDRVFYYDPHEAWRWTQFFPTFCTHVKGELAGRPYELMEYQRQFTAELFGWKLVKDGVRTRIRRYQTAFMGVPRKNSKTLWVSGIGIGLTVIDNEPGAEVYIAASTEEQADIGFDMAKMQIEQNKDLDAMLEVVEKAIYNKASNGCFKVLSSVPKGKHGFNVHGAIIDEYHELQDKALVNVLRKGMIARLNPLLLYTTTAGDSTDSPAYKEWEYAKKVINGDIINPRYLACIYEAQIDDQNEDYWRDEKVWASANPGFGQSVNIDVLRQIYEEAVGSPQDEADFKTYHLNIWHNGAQDYIRDEEWRRCYEDYKIEDLYGKPCVAGLDLASSRDMCALTLVFPANENGEMIYRQHPIYWAPEKAIKERSHRGYKYPDWIADGYLRETRGNVADYKRIRQDIVELGKLFDIREIAYDPFHANEICVNLANEDGFKMIECRQTFLSLGPATKRYLELVLDKHIRHNNHPVLTWNVGNARVISDGKENIMISKKKSISKDKIDGLVAGIMGLQRAIMLGNLDDGFFIEVW